MDSNVLVADTLAVADDTELVADSDTEVLVADKHDATSADSVKILNSNLTFMLSTLYSDLFLVAYTMNIC